LSNGTARAWTKNMVENGIMEVKREKSTQNLYPLSKDHAIKAEKVFYSAMRRQGKAS